MQRINQELFDWITWRNGSLIDLDCFTRTDFILKNASRLKKFAIGYCNADGLLCRPKVGYFAVMFSLGERTFWTHLKREEFELLKSRTEPKGE